MEKWTYEDLKAFAGKCCLDIFRDFDKDEVSNMPKSIQVSWEIGRQLSLY